MNVKPKQIQMIVQYTLKSFYDQPFCDQRVIYP